MIRPAKVSVYFDLISTTVILKAFQLFSLYFSFLELSGVYYPEYPWHYGSYPYGYPHYPYPYQHPHVAAPSPVVVHPALHPAVHPAHATIHYPYPYNYPYGYNYWNYSCVYPGCETHLEPEENKPAEESKEENEDKEDKKSNIDQ